MNGRKARKLRRMAIKASKPDDKFVDYSVTLPPEYAPVIPFGEVYKPEFHHLYEWKVVTPGEPKCLKINTIKARYKALKKLFTGRLAMTRHNEDKWNRMFG